MNRAVFDELMKAEKWECIGKPDVANEVSPEGSKIDWLNRAEQVQYKRGIFIISITEQDIEKMEDEHFQSWFENARSAYRFDDDWKKAFKGSEFLEPVVEEEFLHRRLDLIIKSELQLNLIYQDAKPIEDVMKEMEDEIEALVEKIRQYKS